MVIYWKNMGKYGDLIGKIMGHLVIYGRYPLVISYRAIENGY